MGGAKWGGSVEKGGILVVVVFRFALLYLAQPATMVRTARPEIRSRPSALCWRVGIAVLLLVLAARDVRVDGAFLVQNQVRVNSAVRQRLYQRVFCSKLAIVCVCAAILDGCSTARDVYASMAFCFCKSTARYVALHCRGTIPRSSLALTQQ